jgi:hypothetical protein
MKKLTKWRNVFFIFKGRFYKSLSHKKAINKWLLSKADTVYVLLAGEYDVICTAEIYFIRFVSSDVKYFYVIYCIICANK